MQRILLAIFVLGLAGACASGPPPVMPAEDFESALTAARAETHPYEQAEALESIEQANVLSEAQLAQLLFERGKTLRLARIDLPEAISVLEAALALMPADSPHIASAQSELEFAREDLARSRARMQGLQTLPDWASDAVMTGELEAVAERYRASGLAPDAELARLLRVAGYLCQAPEESDLEDAFVLGESIDHLDGIIWCENPGVS